MTGFQHTETGRGVVTRIDDSFRLTVPPVTKDHYHNAQISSYGTTLAFTHKPPLLMSLTAHAEGKLQGTAGFGFWNHPYVPGSWRVRLPKAVWFFFGSPPNDMPLAKGVPGHGWKAATFNAANWRFLTLLPVAPLGYLLMRVPALYNRLWPIGQRAIGVSERLVDSALLQQPHQYQLDWREGGVTFRIDDKIVHETSLSPPGPLGFVAWVDNQFAVVTPQGRFNAGWVDVPQEQALVIEGLEIGGG